MKRNIVSTITFANGKVGIIILEKISTNIVELFNDFSSIDKINDFFATSFKKIEAMIGGKFSEVGIIIETTSKTYAKIKFNREEIQIVGKTVVHQDIDNLIKITKQKFESENRKVISVQPTQFDVQDIFIKSYDKAPIHKKGNKLFANLIVTSISAKVYDYINQIVKSQGLNISQILLSSQAISQSNLSIAALKSGAILINISKKQTFMTINKNFATIGLMLIDDFGYNNLLSGITKIFKCSKKEASNLVYVYGSLDVKNKNCVIYIHQDYHNKVIHYAHELEKIIKLFINKLAFIINKFLEQKNIISWPIVFSGKLKKIANINEYLKKIMNNEFVSIYNPISFVEINEKNIWALGFLNYMKTIDQIMGKEFNTIVETNPNLISAFIKNDSKKWYIKVIEKLGVKYE